MPKKTFEYAKRAKAKLIVQVKGNQGSLHKQIIHGCTINKPLAVFDEEWTKAHGRLEKRTYEVFNPSSFLKKWPEWADIKRIIRVTRFREHTHKSKKHKPRFFYYASNACLKKEIFAQAIREHWLCENKNHYVRDTAFLEDKTTKRVTPFNFCVLISLSLNILRSYNCNNIRGTLVENSMDFNKLQSYSNLFVG